MTAWGAKSLIALNNALQFNISTPLYPKGVKLRITLNFMDSYDIEVIDTSENIEKVIEKSTDIYCDLLIEAIDQLIEKNKKTQILFS
jgi:hypothetical protein